MTPDIIIKDLQKKFQQEYPHLDLKFFQTLSRGKNMSTIKKFCDPLHLLGDALNLTHTGSIEIRDDMTVNELVLQFYEQFGVHAQVFRQSANLWMEITLTNNWTLVQQNNHGREISIQ